MKYILCCFGILGLTTIAAPVDAQFSSFPSGSDNCSSFCVRLDFGSANNDNSFNSGFNGSSTTGNSSPRWQVGVTWRPNPPEVAQQEAERTKQQLEDNRSLMVTLADAIAQNKTELARGLAIILAPRLGYRNPITLIAEMKQGSMNIGSVAGEIFKGSNPNNDIPPTIQGQEGANSTLAPTIELR